MIELIELFRHWHGGRSQVQIASALGIDRKTIRKYVAAAVAAGLEPGEGDGFDEAVWRARIAGWFPDVVDASVRAWSWPAIAPHREWVEGQLAASVTVATIAQRLRDDRGVAASESTVRRWVTAEFAGQVAAARVTIPRGAVPPGQGGRRGKAAAAALVVAAVLYGWRRYPVACAVALTIGVAAGILGAASNVLVLLHPYAG